MKIKKDLRNAEVQRNAIFSTLQILNDKLDRQLSACSPNNTLKQNNWDSIKEAFKGQIRRDE